MSRRFFLIFPLTVVLALLPACETFRFYGQAVGGQMEILRKSRSNREVVVDPTMSPIVRKQLATVDGIRKFASEHLSLPGDESYGKYADLGRKHVVWVLYAAPEFSLEPKTWFYPAVGEMDYRGYFREEHTVGMSERLKAEGYDVCIGGVDAYSTLGWFHDPVLNTFIDYPDIDLAETIFHELSHRVVFRKGDTMFNESMANVVAEEGVKRWLRHEKRSADLKQYEGRIVRRREFYQEIDRARRELKALYTSGQPAETMREKKKAILVKLRAQFLELRRRWGGKGLEGWLKEDLNNGHIVSLNLYTDLMPHFENLLGDCGGDLELFFKKAETADFAKGRD
jgi:predicted aminopeptidase